MKSQTINVLGHRDVYCATAPNVTEVCIFNVFAHEILPVDDAVWRWQSFIYEEFKDIFEENKQGSDGKSCAWTHFVAFEMADKAKPSRSLLLTASYCIFMRGITFLFLFKKKSISEWYFPKNREIGSLVVRPWEKLKNWQNRELGPACGVEEHAQLLISSSCLMISLVSKSFKSS